MSEPGGSDPAAGGDAAAAMRNAYLALKKQQARITELEAALEARREPVAIVGLGCRFPGGVRGPESFWRRLREGFDAVGEVPADRWSAEAHFDADPEAPGKISTRCGAFLDEVDRFDAAFFGISAREAEAMDPQQRILLETAWEALEDAGIPPPSLAGSATGVFVGLTMIDYAKLAAAGGLAGIDAHTATGNVANIAAGRISYVLGLNGPALALDTACSSSLVAAHLACQSLRTGESTLALAAGVNVMLSPESAVAVSRARMLSPSGRCRAFDAAADGYGRGEGCGVAVLKLLSRARADGDRVIAVLRASGVAQDGARSGLTVPNGPAQAALIRRVLKEAGVPPAAIGYLEAHGTGTSLGDPIEAEALAAVFGADASRRAPLVLGSLKTNVGHMESAAGIGGLIKAALTVAHGEIPPHLHFQRENPELRLADIPARIPVARQPWPAEAGRRIAGVSSFGSSGTIAHVLVEEPPPALAAAPGGQPPWWLLLSAKTKPAQRELAARMAAWLEALPEDAAAGDICWTAAAGRAHFAHRMAVAGGTVRELAAALRAHAAPPPGSPGAAYLAGQDPDLTSLFGGWRGRRVALPAYPFARDRHWIGPAPAPPAPDCFWEIAWRPVPPGTPLPPDAQRWAVVGGGAAGAALAGCLKKAGHDAAAVPAGAPLPERTARIVLLQPLEGPADLAGALDLLRRSRGRFWAVTRGAQAAGGEAPDPDGAALWGLLRILPVEQPARWGGLIDLDPAEPAAAQIEPLAEALLSAPGEDQRARRGGAWLAARLAKRPEAELPREIPAAAVAGAWLVTGGLSGLGWAAAGWLAEKGAQALLLIGRRPPGPEQAAALERWNRAGIRAEAVAADCADAAALGRALASWRSRGGPAVSGVIHAAGTWQDAPLAELTAEGLEAVWRPKVDGARALAAALRDEPPAQWIYFSAFSALLPALGQGNYAAANAWLDARARRQRAEGRRALAINWGPWSEIGFAASDYGRRAHERLESLGIVRFRPEAGLAVLERAWASGRPQLAAMPVDWAKFFAADPQARLSPLLAERAAESAAAPGPEEGAGRIAKALATAAPEQHAGILTEEIRRLVGGVLRAPGGMVPADVPFTELGVDSLLAVEIKNRLQRQAEVDLPLADLLRGPSAAGLAAQLLPRAKAAALAHLAPAAGPVEEIEL
ncbi:MAG TPA: SDR family NAD(P)-dependent oxidoreductase [Opitutaceae bacterium]|nr:SDR family NAD(P)-dependent oxidoreductase [Opitutaceae bacterium]